MGKGQNLYQIGKKICYLPKASKFYMEIWYVTLHFADQNMMQREYPIELNPEGFEMQKRNISTNKTQRADEKN